MLDEKLTFTNHVNMICTTALGALNSIFHNIESTKIDMGLHLYRCLVRPHLERTYPIWCATNNTNIRKVGRIQRQDTLLRISRLFVSTPAANLEVLTHTTPLQEVLLQEYMRICRRPPRDHLCNQVHVMLRSIRNSSEGPNTPIKMLAMALRTFPYSSSFNNMEPSPIESLSRLSADTPP